jgi:TonB-linked SusC/RagA family outer membrane protein
MERKLRLNSSRMKYPVLVAALLILSPAAQAGDYEATKVTHLNEVTQSARKLTGNVVDESGQPLIGVTISLSSGNGTITDIDGNFTLNNVPANAVLTFSYVGYKDQKVSVGGKSAISVKMISDDKVLDEVVVIGYGVQKKSNVTGAISSVKAEDLKNNVVSNAASALQGKVSGVQVVNNSGAPGANPTIRVRGYSSNGKSDPLYIVDGLKVSDISYLDPNSIKSIEILKDAASAAIYGAEAGNGVVLITTKTGDKGTTKITLETQWTYSNLAKKVKLLNADEFTKYYTEAGGDAFTTLYNQYYIKGTDTDWQDEMYETGTMQKYNLGLQGGNDKGGFFVSLGYFHNDGIVKLDKDYYRRISGQINANYNLRPWLEVGTTNTIISSKSSTISESSAQYGQMKDILLSEPLIPVTYDSANLPARLQTVIAKGLHPLQNSNGDYYGYSWLKGGASNPLATIDAATGTYRMNYINGMTYANIKPIKGLVFTTRLGYTIGNVGDDSFAPKRWGGFYADADNDMRLNSAQYTTVYYQWENFFNYLLSTKDMGDFAIMAGMSYSDKSRNSVSTQTNELSSDAKNYRYMNYSTNSADDYVKGSLIYKRQIAYYGRLSWNYLDRYYCQFNFRADSYDSAYLDLHHNWGYFPSVSVGWTFSNEDFMKGVTGKGFSYGKLRLSYGVNGSISNLGDYMYASNLRTGQYDIANSTANMAYWLDGQLYKGTYPNSTLANPKLRWERSKQFDAGLDLRFLDGRLSATMDYYHKMTDGLLVQSVAPLVTGTSTVYQNLGKVLNSGLELELEWRDHIGDFGYGVKGNIAILHNKVTKYRGKGTRISGSGLLSASSALTYFEEDYPLWYIRGYKMTGVNQQTGEAIYEDIDGDGSITENDRTNLGKGIPDLTYGLTITASYKNFDLNVYGAGACGNKLVYGMMSTNKETWNNRPQFLYDGRWTGTGGNATMPGAVYQLNDSRFYNSDAFVFDASFFKIKQIQLGYTVPKKILGTIGVEAVRAYVSLENFFTFTDYPGSDPEVNASGNSSSALALDFGGYPMSKSVSFGLNVSF